MAKLWQLYAAGGAYNGNILCGTGPTFSCSSSSISARKNLSVCHFYTNSPIEKNSQLTNGSWSTGRGSDSTSRSFLSTASLSLHCVKMLINAFSCHPPPPTPTPRLWPRETLNNYCWSRPIVSRSRIGFPFQFIVTDSINHGIGSYSICVVLNGEFFMV